jgi:pimeloyl-ACP methyl ester carboxylesterase
VTDTNLSKPFKKEDRNTNTKAASLFLISLLSLSVLVPWFDKSATNAFGSTISNTGSNNTIVLSNPRIIDPNPDLISIDGTLQRNASLAADINTERLGTTADGVSKLLVIIDSNATLQFSIEGTSFNNITKGVLNSLERASGSGSQYSSATVKPQEINNDKSVVVAVYTPPDHIVLPATGNHDSIQILVNGTSDPRLSFDLYRVPIVLVHGIWVNSQLSWVDTGFAKTLNTNGFNYTFADYQAHNSETFDPYSDPNIGNYGIDSIRNKIRELLIDYRQNKSIAASQVDIVAHSMGGLMARGLVQQPDYENKSNYMKGSIHRLLTIGTPHFGAHLSEILYDHRNDWYCFDSDTKVIIFPNGCQFDLNDFEFLQLKTIYSNRLFLPIDKGGVEALAPDSTAFSHLCPTDVRSYAIAGTWAPNAFGSHLVMEGLFRNILGEPLFNLDIDGFQGNFQGNNDLQVNLTSQVGGLHSEFRQLFSSDIPNQSAVYPNTIHGSIFAFGDVNAIGELGSPNIQNDVVILLESPNSKFATAVGIGSSCSIPN